MLQIQSKKSHLSYSRHKQHMVKLVKPPPIVYYTSSSTTAREHTTVTVWWRFSRAQITLRTIQGSCASVPLQYIGGEVWHVVQHIWFTLQCVQTQTELFGQLLYCTSTTATGQQKLCWWFAPHSHVHTLPILGGKLGFLSVWSTISDSTEWKIGFKSHSTPLH